MVSIGSCFFFFGFSADAGVVYADSADAGSGDVGTGDAGTFLGVGSLAAGFLVSVACFEGGEVVLVCPCFGDPFFFRVTSVHPSWLFCCLFCWA